MTLPEEMIQWKKILMTIVKIQVKIMKNNNKIKVKIMYCLN